MVDVASLARRAYQVDAERFACGPDPTHEQHQGWMSIDRELPIRGWLRRLAPPDWTSGVALESHDAAVKSSWLALLQDLIHGFGIDWLSPAERLVTAENKLLQYATAERLSVRIPRTQASSAPPAEGALADRLVIKPLGPGHFFEDDGSPMVVYTQELRAGSPVSRTLDAAPFLVQELIVARRHLRLVTVNSQLWSAEIDAPSGALDWRRRDEAHTSFRRCTVPNEVQSDALRLADAFQLGYTSQDWIETDDGFVFVDLNPSGQWLFLPEPIAEEVATAIADWLRCEG